MKKARRVQRGTSPAILELARVLAVANGISEEDIYDAFLILLRARIAESISAQKLKS